MGERWDKAWEVAGPVCVALLVLVLCTAITVSGLAVLRGYAEHTRADRAHHQAERIRMLEEALAEEKERCRCSSELADLTIEVVGLTFKMLGLPPAREEWP